MTYDEDTTPIRVYNQPTKETLDNLKQEFFGTNSASYNEVIWKLYVEWKKLREEQGK